MGAALLDLSVIDQDDPVRIAHSGKSVGNDEGCPAGPELIKTFLYIALCHRIQSRGGFIQDQDPWIFQENAGNGDPLLLSAGEHGAPLPDIGVKSLGHLHDIIEDLRLPGSPDHLLVGASGFP